MSEPLQQEGHGKRRLLVSQQLPDSLVAFLGVLALLTVLAISAYLRYKNLPTNPSWEGDEGYNINMAWNLSQGRLQMYAVSYPFVEHPPLFYALLVPLFWMFGPNILALRLLTSTFGVLTTLVLYFLGRDTGGQKVGLFAAGVFAIFPVAITYNRWGYSYNQLMFLGALCAYFTWRYATAHSVEVGPAQAPRANAVRPYINGASESEGKSQSQWTSAVRSYASGALPHRRRPLGWLLAAALTAGLGMASDQEGLFLIAAVLIVTLATNRGRLLSTAAVAFAVPIMCTTAVLLLMPSEVVYDWQKNLTRVSDPNALVAGLTLGINYAGFLGFDYWLVPGIAGIFLMADKKARTMLVLFTFVALVFILKIRNPNPVFRSAIPLLPFVSLGFAVFLVRATEYLYKWGTELWFDAMGDRWHRSRSLAIMSCVFAIIYLPLASILAMDVFSVHGTLRLSNDDLSPKSLQDAQSMADFVNGSTRTDDLVIVSPYVSWLLTAHTTHLSEAVVAEGKETPFSPANVPASRFVYDARYNRAKYVVLDDFSRAWAKEMPEEGKIAREVTTSWPVAFHAGEYVVYQNPMAK